MKFFKVTLLLGKTQREFRIYAASKLGARQIAKTSWPSAKILKVEDSDESSD